MFREKRLAFNGIEAPAAAGERVPDSRRKEVEAFMGMLEENKVVEKGVMEDNPLLGELDASKIPSGDPKGVNIFADRPGEMEFGFKVVDRKERNALLSGKTNVFPDSDFGRAVAAVDSTSNVDGPINVDAVLKDENKFTIDGLAYAALVWPKIKDGVRGDLRGNRLSDDQVNAALVNYNNYPKLKDLILERAKGLKSKGMTFELTAKKAAGQINVDKALVETSANLGRGSLKMTLEAVRLKEQSLSKFELRHNEDLPALTKKQLEGDVDRSKWLEAKNLREENIHPSKWEINTPRGLAEVRYDMSKGLNIPIENAPWVAVFNELAKASDSDFLKGKNAEWFKDPEKYKKELDASGEESFLTAYRHFMAIKNSLSAVEDTQILLDQKLADKDKIPVLSTVIDGFKSNIGKFTEAVRTKDYATAAVYLAGVWGVWKIMKGSGKFGEFLGKVAPWVAVGGLGLLVANNAGIDLIKMAGFKNGYDDFKGTSIAEMFNVPGVEMKDVDSGVLKEASTIPLKQLWKAYQEAPSAKFADPLVASLDVYQGRFGGLPAGNADRMKNGDYKRTGEQLFLIMGIIKTIYEKIPFEKGSRYDGVSFNDLMNGEEGSSLLPDFMAEISQFTHEKLDDGGNKDVSKRMGQVFDGLNLNPSFVPATVNGQEVMGGMVAGYPIVLVAKGDSYIVFDRAEFGLSGLKANGMLRVPREGEVDADLKTRVGVFADVIKKKAEAMIVKAVPGAVSKLKWNGNYWSYDKTGDARLSNFGITPQNTEVKVLISASGKVEEVEVTGGLHGEILKKIVADDKFASLAPMFNKGLIEMVEVGVAGVAEQVKLKIAEVEVILRYDATNGFEFVSGEADLMKNEKFMDAYVESWIEDETMGIAGDLKEIFELIKGANADYLGTAWNTLFSGGTAGNPLSDNLTLGSILNSSVPENYPQAISEIVGYHASKNLHNLAVSSSFDELSKNSADVIRRLKDNLETVKTQLSNHAGQEWPSTDFTFKVLKPLVESPCRSREYRTARSVFNDNLYKSLSGVINLSAFDKATHAKANEAIKIWLDFSVELDNESLDKFPENAQKLAYLKYLETKIIGKAAAESINAGGIMKFNEWKSANVSVGPMHTVSEGPFIEGNVLKQYIGLEVRAQFDILEHIFGDKIYRYDNGNPVMYDLFNTATSASPGEKSKFQNFVEDILNASGDSRIQQIVKIQNWIQEKIVNPVLENTDGKYRKNEGAEGAIGSAIEVSKEALGKIADWSKEKATALAAALSDGFTIDDTIISLPPVSRGPIVVGFPSVLKTVEVITGYKAKSGASQYQYFSNGNKLQLQTLAPSFTSIKQGWEESVEKSKIALKVWIDGIKKRAEKNPNILTDDVKKSIDKALESLEKEKKQLKTAEILLGYLEHKDGSGNYDEHDDFFDYCKNHKDKF